jgi:ribosome-binding protein aMBF1 (putative translation factor)
MSVVAKKHPTEKVTIKVGNHQAEVFYLQKPVAGNLLQLIKSFQPQQSEEDWVEFSEVFPELNDPAERIASALRGARYKKEMTQVELAKMLNITQGDLSKMEHGKRPIGKNLAMRLSKILKVDYRIFL